MGNHRFRLSDMMPNAWFYKLKDMSKRKTRKSKSPNAMKQAQSSPTASQKSHFSSHQPNFPYHFTTNPTMSERVSSVPASRTKIHDSPRRSSKKKSQRKTIYMPSPKFVSSVSHDHVSRDPLLNESSDCFVSSAESDFHELFLSESETDSFAAPSPLDCRVTSSTTDIIIDMNDDCFTRKAGNGDTIPELELPPIVTKPGKFNNDQADISRRSSSNVKSRHCVSARTAKEESIRASHDQTKDSAGRKSLANSGIRLRANSPKIASKKLQASARKSVSSKTRMKVRKKSISESFAIVKSSFDPERDFRDSMMEMIMENNIWESKDLEDLLACYLSLNSNEYHGIIIKAFEQIWFDLTHSQL